MGSCLLLAGSGHLVDTSPPVSALLQRWYLVLLFTSFLAIPLARQSSLDTLLFARFQVVGVTLDFLDNILLLYLTLESAQRIFERFAFLNSNLSQEIPPPNLPDGFVYHT